MSHTTSPPRKPIELLSIPETCNLLGVSNSTLRRFIKTGKLQTITFGERCVRIPRESIEAMMIAGLRKAA